jgi:cytoskeleton protein RodZ
LGTPSVAHASAQVGEGADVNQLTKSLGPTGALLKATRQLRGLSLQQLSETTRISSRYLDAVEREDFDTLPSAAAFVRGYVREMARILELDIERVVEGYMRRFSGDG